MPITFTAKTLYDALGSFGGGTNEGDVPLDLPLQVMAGSVNTTVRGKFATHRPSYWKRSVNFASTQQTITIPGAITPPNPTPPTQTITIGGDVPDVGLSYTFSSQSTYSGNVGDIQLLQTELGLPPLINIAKVLITDFTNNTITVQTIIAYAPGATIDVPVVFTLQQLAPPSQAPSTTEIIEVPPNTALFTSGYFQGSCFATDDAGNASFVALISNQIFQFQIQGNTLKCAQIYLPRSTPTVVQPQAWLWQSERWVIVDDGVNLPIFLDLNGGVGVTPSAGLPNFGTATISNSGTAQKFNTTTSSGFATTAASSTATTTGTPSGNTTQGVVDTDGGVQTYSLYQAINETTTTTNVTTGQSVGIPSIGAINTVAFTSTANLNQSDIVTIQSVGQFSVQSISGNIVTLLNLSATNIGGNFSAGVPITWQHIGQQLPPGCMGAYGMGRNWIALPGQLTFIAGDIVRGDSGTQAYGFRDSVLNVTENNFIVGGGAFSIPATGGETIQAMMFLATINVALGQGPLQVFTNRRVFSCNAPVDRLTWQSLTNPILTVSLIGNGAEGQNSTLMANGDPIFRSVDGVRSLTFDQVQFSSLNNLWINSPLSFEVSPVLQNDSTALLQWGSGIVFDNRLLMTCSPASNAQGVYFAGLVPINFDTVSTMKSKSPPVWDSGQWTGMNILQLLTGEVQNVDRAFAFCLNTSSTTSGIEVYEILPSSGPLSAINDYNGTAQVPITWQFDSASLRFGIQPKEHVYMYLSNGEIWVDNLIGSVTFTVQYIADQYPIWTTWQSWTSSQSSSYAASGYPAFLPRQGLGEPSPSPCDPNNNRQLRNGFTFQTRTIVVGHCVIVGEFYEAQTLPMVKFAPIVCSNSNNNNNNSPNNTVTNPPSVQCGNYGGTTPNFIPSVSCLIVADGYFATVPALWIWINGAWSQITAGQP